MVKLVFMCLIMIKVRTRRYIKCVFKKPNTINSIPKTQRPEMEFKEFKPRFKSAKTRFKFSAGLNLETFDTILCGTNHI